MAKRRASEGADGRRVEFQRDYRESPLPSVTLAFEQRAPANYPMASTLLSTSLPGSPKNLLCRFASILRKKLKGYFKDTVSGLLELKLRKKEWQCMRAAEMMAGRVRCLLLRRYFAKFAFVIILMTSIDIGSSLLYRALYGARLRFAFSAFKNFSKERVL